MPHIAILHNKVRMWSEGFEEKLIDDMMAFTDNSPKGCWRKGKWWGLMVLLSEKNNRPEMGGMRTETGIETAGVFAVMLGLRHHQAEGGEQCEECEGRQMGCWSINRCLSDSVLKWNFETRDKSEGDRWPGPVVELFWICEIYPVLLYSSSNI